MLSGKLTNRRRIRPTSRWLPSCYQLLPDLTCNVKDVPQKNDGRSKSTCNLFLSMKRGSDVGLRINSRAEQFMNSGENMCFSLPHKTLENHPCYNLLSHSRSNNLNLTNSYCRCESQHLQARRIQRLNSKFILVRIRNTDHVLRVRWDQNPLTEIWQWWFVMFGRKGRGVTSGRNGVLQWSVIKIGGEQLLSTAESSINHSHGKLQQQGDHILL